MTHGEAPAGRDSRRSGLLSLLLPAVPRSFPGRRGVKIVLRAAHVLSAGTATGAYLFDASPDLRTAWLIAAAASGGLMLLLDLHETAAFLFQIRGAIVLAKLGLLAALPYFAARHGAVLGTIVVVSVLFSHAPSSVRYRMLAGAGRFKGAETKG